MIDRFGDSRMAVWKTSDTEGADAWAEHVRHQGEE